MATNSAKNLKYIDSRLSIADVSIVLVSLINELSSFCVLSRDSLFKAPFRSLKGILTGLLLVVLSSLRFTLSCSILIRSLRANSFVRSDARFDFKYSSASVHRPSVSMYVMSFSYRTGRPSACTFLMMRLGRRLSALATKDRLNIVLKFKRSEIFRIPIAVVTDPLHCSAPQVFFFRIWKCIIFDLCSLVMFIFLREFFQ